VVEAVRPEQGPQAPSIGRRAFYRDPRYLVLIVLAIAVVVLTLVKHRELADLWHSLGALRPTTVLFALACQLVKFVAIAFTFHLLLRVLNYRIPVPYLFRAGLAMVFLNQTVPSMGTSGNAFMYTALQRRGVSSGSAIIITILNLLTFYIAFFMLAFGGVIYLATGRVLKPGHVIGLCVFLLMMLSLFTWIRARSQTEARLARTINDINRIVRKLTWGALAEAIPGHFADDFLAGRAMIAGSKKHFILPVVTNLVMFLADTATLFVVFRGLGLGPEQVLYRHVVAGYVVGVIIYAFAFVPGALGVYEFGMAGMFIALGVPRSAAFAASILFRGFNFWLPIPIGFAFYHTMMNHRHRTPGPVPAPEPASTSEPM